MTQQTVQNKPLKTWTGILYILAIVAVLILMGQALRLLEPLIGYTAASIGIWVIGGIIAIFVMRDRVLAYRYTLDGKRMIVGRLYGTRERFMTQVIFRQILAIGDEAAMRAKYPDARLERAIRKQCDLPIIAIAYRQDADRRILLCQPDEKIRQEIEERRNTREKKAETKD